MTKAKLNSVISLFSHAFPIFFMSGFQKNRSSHPVINNMKTMINAHQLSLKNSITPQPYRPKPEFPAITNGD